jgi:uncharacterized glyoxalase superfamily protein PhnB
MRTRAKERKGTEMIKDVPLTGIFVNDQEAALDFYTTKLGASRRSRTNPTAKAAHARSRSLPRDTKQGSL